MKLRRLVSLILCVMMIAGISAICVINAQAADTQTAGTGAIANYYNASYLENKAYSGTDLGSTYSKASTTWKVWSPDATKIQLKLYATGSDFENGAKNLATHNMTKNSTTGVWSITLTGDYKNVYYTYVVTASAGTHETFDIYAEACGVNGDRSMVVDLDSTDPDGWENDNHVFLNQQTDAIVWEVHVADLTAGDTSDVDKNYQGKYLGFAEGGLTLNGEGDISVGIDYLVDQGINCVHIQCPFDFASGDESNPESYNWGYDPKNYNCPEGLYSTNPYDGNVRITEFKQMIQALHDRGISVVMGVVYNHTFVTEQSAFTYTVPGYYYRMMSATQYYNGTGCGNTLATDKAMFQNYMIQSLKHWVEEYHVDGFRFDIMGAHDYLTMNKIRSTFNSMYNGEGKKIIMYGEPWSAGDPGIPSSYEAGTQNMSKISANIGGFNATVRQAINGSESGTMKGWIQGSTVVSYANNLKSGAVGTYGAFPNQSIVYADCHDGVTLWDNILLSQGAVKSSSPQTAFATTDAKYRGQLRTALTYIMTSQGVPFTLAGTEFARSKYGNGNSYNLPDNNMFDWTRLQTYATEVAYAKGLRQIRAAFSAFRNSNTKNSVTWLTTSRANSILAYSLNNNVSGEWNKAVVVVNNGAAGTVTLPSGTWTIIANDTKAGVASLGTASGTYNIGAYCSAVLVQGTSTVTAPTYGTVTVNHYESDGTLIKTSTQRYKTGTTWRALADNYTLFDHELTKVENSAGTKSGTTVYGTVAANQKVTVSFTYKPFNTSGLLTVKFVDESGAEVAAPVEYRYLDGTVFNIPFENVQGYELVSSKYPNNFCGTFDAKNPTTITFVYKKLASDSITVYYYRSSVLSTGTLRMYAYTNEELKPLGAWDTALQNMEKVTNVAELPKGEVVGNWYKKVIDKSNCQITPVPSSCKVMFLTSGSGKQEPLNGESGYEASGVIYVKNKTVIFNAKVITSHIDAETGKKLAEDVVVNYDDVTNSDIYTTAAKSGFGEATTPNNASGGLVAGSTCVVYMYNSETEKPSTPPNTDPTGTTGPVTGGILLGDADLNNDVNIKDATLIQKHAAKIIKLSDSGNLAADVDVSKEVNVRDATAIQKYIAKIPVDYAIGEIIPGTGTPSTNPGTKPYVEPTGVSGLKAELTELYADASGLLSTKSDYNVESPLALTSSELALKEGYGFVIANEDTSKNEFQKYKAALSTASSYVVSGGSDAELQNAINELDKNYKWFDYYVTTVHPEPGNGGGTSDGITVYFSNNKYWSTVNAYTWVDGGAATAEWPGSAMTFEKKNDFGEDIYSFAIPAGCTNIIFNNGSAQSVDIPLAGVTSGTGFYLDTTTDAAGHFNFGTYVYS